MKTNQSLINKLGTGTARLTALALGLTLCFAASGAFARDPGRGVGGAGAGVRPGAGVGGVGAGAARVATPAGVGHVGGVGVAGVGAGAPGVGVGAPGAGVLPAGYIRTVPVGYTTVVYRGYSCRYVGGVYYRAVMYQGSTVYVVVK